MTDETRKLESIKSAQESAKQIITLCTAIITLIFGVVSIGGVGLGGIALWLAVIILAFLFISIVTGVLTLFALSGILTSGAHFHRDDPLNSSHYMWFGRTQFFSFLLAVFYHGGFRCFFFCETKQSRKRRGITLQNFV
jgi:hypothetical protein